MNSWLSSTNFTYLKIKIFESQSFWPTFLRDSPKCGSETESQGQRMRCNRDYIPNCLGVTLWVKNHTYCISKLPWSSKSISHRFSDMSILVNVASYLHWRWLTKLFSIFYPFPLISYNLNENFNKKKNHLSFMIINPFIVNSNDTESMVNFVI